MYANKRILYPNRNFLDINFEDIKNKLHRDENKVYDNGSIVLIQGTKYTMSINDRGKIEFFYNMIDEEALDEKIKEIEILFRTQIKDFEIIH